MSAPTDDAVARVRSLAEQLDDAASTARASEVTAAMATAEARRIAADLRTMLARLEVAEADARRLDWWQSAGSLEAIRNYGPNWRIVLSTGPDTSARLGEGDTLRAALDHAMRGGA